MALQDDIFDIQAALHGKPEQRAFTRIVKHMNAAETLAGNQEKVLNALAGGIKALRWIEREIK